MLSRRGFLMTGGASALVAGLGTVTYAWAPGRGPATQAWQQAGTDFGDARLNALAFAILAPNPHNRQPWWFELVGNDRIDVYCDPDKRLPHTDPYDRQITIGFGCLLELLRQAGTEAGYRVETEEFPDGSPEPRLNGNRIAQVRFVADDTVQPDPLFAHALDRRSTKEPFDPSRPVSEASLAGVLAGAQTALATGGTVDPERTRRIVQIALDGWTIEYETARTRRESVDLMRIGNRAVARDPDGIDVGGLSMGLLNLAGIVTASELDTPGSQAYNIGLDLYSGLINSAQGFAWIITDDNSRKTQLAAGAAWVRMNLAAQATGLCVHPLSQVLQEFSEMQPQYEAIKTELGVPRSGTVQMLGRLGYAAFPPPSPRWPLDAKLVPVSE